MSNTAHDQQHEVDENLEFFLSELPKIDKAQIGKFALLHRKSIVGFYETPLDAVTAGNLKYADKRFSIQQVAAEPIDLGYYSHARGVRGSQ